MSDWSLCRLVIGFDRLGIFSTFRLAGRLFVGLQHLHQVLLVYFDEGALIHLNVAEETIVDIVFCQWRVSADLTVNVFEQPATIGCQAFGDAVLVFTKGGIIPVKPDDISGLGGIYLPESRRIFLLNRFVFQHDIVRRGIGMDGRIDDGVGSVCKYDLESMFRADGAIVRVEVHGLIVRGEMRGICRGVEMSLGPKAIRVEK